MPGSTGPNLGLVSGYSAHEAGWGIGGFNPNMSLLDAIVMLTVANTTTTAPPGSPAAGDRYVVGASATGAWVGHDHDLAIYRDSAWEFYTPKTGWRALNLATSTYVHWNGTTWIDEGTVPVDLEDLADVTITSVADGQALLWNATSGKWENTTLSAVPVNLNDLGDVTITSPSTSQVIAYTGSGWENTAAPSGGAIAHPGFVTGKYYSRPIRLATVNTTMFANALYASPFFSAIAFTFSKMAIQVATLVAGASAHLFVYGNLSGIPNTLILDAGTVTIDSTGTREITGLTVNIPAGYCWLVAAVSANASIRSSSNSDFIPELGIRSPLTSSPDQGVTGTWVYGIDPVPATFPTVTWANLGFPLVFLSP